MTLRYLSLFSGIEAATVAWASLDWEPVAFAQFDPEHDYSRGVPDFPSAVLRHHYPTVPNLGDVTKITDADIAMLGPVDIVVGGSPCFTAGHLVLCARGLVPIEEVVVGDSVWTHRGRWRPVTATMTRTAPTVVLKGQGHNVMRATPDHPFYAAATERVWNGNGYTRVVGGPRWVRAERMAGLRWATPLALTAPDGCDPPEALAVERGAYLAGLYVGDGHISRRPGRESLAVILSVSETKRDRILPALREAWGTVSDLAHTGSTRRLQLSRTAAASALLESFGEGAHAKTIPIWAFDMPEAWRRAFLRGVLDTDGSPIANGWRVTTVSRKLAIGLRLLAAGLGYSTALHFSERAPTHALQGRTVNQRDTWTVHLRHASRASELRTSDHAWGLVRSVERAEDAPVYDITVDEDHSFICDGIVVHNCQDLSAAGNRAGLDGSRSELFFEQVRIFNAARRYCGARFLLWENVPGAFSSHGGRDFAVVVAAMAGLDSADIVVPPKGWGAEGAAVGPQGMVEWATLDAQWFGVAQRRQRVFALCDAGDWTRRCPVLLEPARLRGDRPSRAAQGEGAGPDPRAGADAGREAGVHGPGLKQPYEVANRLTVRMHKGINTTLDEGQTPVLMPVPSSDVAHAICANEQRTYTNEGTIFQLRNVVAQPVGVTRHGTDVDPVDSLVPIAFVQNQRDEVRTMPYTGAPAVAYSLDIYKQAASTDVTQTLCSRGDANGGVKRPVPAVASMIVRRLTVEECEALQGFPRGYTAITWRGKPAADGPRYKALGNSMAVPVMRWIGERIDVALMGEG